MILTLEEFINEAKSIKSRKMKFDEKKQRVYFVDTWFPVTTFIKDFPKHVEYSFERVNNEFNLKYHPRDKKHYYRYDSKQGGDEFKNTVKIRKVLNVYLSEYGANKETLNNEIKSKIENLPNLIDYKILDDKHIRLTFMENDEEVSSTRNINPDGTIDV